MADDHSNPPSLSYVRLGVNATVREMALAAASLCSGIPSQRAQYCITVRAVGRAIVDGLPAFYPAAAGSLTRLTPDHNYWSQLLAYLAGETTRTEVDAGWNWVRDRPTYDQKKVPINRDWIDQVTVKKGDYVKFLRDQNEPIPEWWPASIKADRAHSGKRTGAATSKHTAGILDDQPNVDEELGVPSGYVGKHKDNAFTSMDGLTWDEITITFIETESVRVRARGKSETFTFDAMGFKHRTSHMAKPNECWKTFMRLAVVSTTNTTWNDGSPTHDLKKRISRLRGQLQRFFGIAGDPIAFRKSVGYQPAFNLTIEEHVIRNMRERYVNGADEDEGDNIQRVMSEVPGTWPR